MMTYAFKQFIFYTPSTQVANKSQVIQSTRHVYSTVDTQLSEEFFNNFT